MNVDLMILGGIAFAISAGGIYLLRQPVKPSRREQRIDALLGQLEKDPEHPVEDENSISLTARESKRILEMLENPPPFNPRLRRGMLENLLRKTIDSEERTLLLADFIDGLIETLSRHPELRIGQVISNAVAIPPATDLYHCHDVILAKLVRLVGATEKNSQNGGAHD